MSKISRVAAFIEITRAMENDELEKANKMFKIVTESIADDKKNNTFSEYIQLKNQTQKKLFENILVEDETE